MTNERIQESIRAATNAHVSSMRSWNFDLKGRRVCILAGQFAARAGVVDVVGFFGEKFLVRCQLLDENMKPEPIFTTIEHDKLHFLLRDENP